jgi:hypothetical protein
MQLFGFTEIRLDGTSRNPKINTEKIRAHTPPVSIYADRESDAMLALDMSVHITANITPFNANNDPTLE